MSVSHLELLLELCCPGVVVKASREHLEFSSQTALRVCKCLEMSRNVSKCLEMSRNVSKCLEMSRNVSKCLEMSRNVSKCLESTMRTARHWKNIGKRCAYVCIMEANGETNVEKVGCGDRWKRCRGLHILRDPFCNVDSCVVTANKERTTSHYAE